MAHDWKKIATVNPDILSVGNGLALAFGVLTASVTSGLGFDGSGNIVVKNGSGIAIDGTGHVTVNQGAGLAIDGSGFLVVNAGTGLSTAGGQVFIPGGAITNSLMAALSIGAAQIQSNAVGTAKIQAAAITTALIANAAITNALLGTAVVGTANIQNAAITTALIANLAVGNAQISDLAAGKITAGTITASISMTSPNITSTFGSLTAQLNNGSLVCTNGSGTTTTITGANINVTDSSHLSQVSQSAGFWSDLSLNNLTLCSSTEFYFKAGGVKQLDVVSGSMNLTSMALQISGTTVIDTSRNGSFVNLSFSGTGPYTSGNYGLSISSGAISVIGMIGRSGGGIQVTSTAAPFNGNTGVIASFVQSNGIYVYNNSGTYVGQIPLI